MESMVTRGICPRCGRAYTGHPALSRTDGMTKICPECGTREALESIGIAEDEQAEILETIRRYTGGIGNGKDKGGDRPMAWYKVRMVVPGTDGDAESGFCGLQYWDDHVEAENEAEAIRKANEQALQDWETPDEDFPSPREMGLELPVCTGAWEITEAEHAAWVKEMEEYPELPFQ